MHLRILLPARVFADIDAVASVVVETLAGSVGLLPHRLDCIAALSPGILSYASSNLGKVYVALDGGVMAKNGGDVWVSTRRAISGTDLAALHATVKQEFESVDIRERQARTSVAKMESALLGRLRDLQHAG